MSFKVLKIQDQHTKINYTLTTPSTVAKKKKKKILSCKSYKTRPRLVCSKQQSAVERSPRIYKSEERHTEPMNGKTQHRNAASSL